MGDIGFCDIHCHILPGLDDGAVDIQESVAMLKIACREGIDTICFTPHIRRPWLEVSASDVQKAFLDIQKQMSVYDERVKLFLGSEVYYCHEVIEEYPEKIRTINNTDYVLVEFNTGISWGEMKNAILDLQNDGYDILVAHIERYTCLVEDIDNVVHLANMGCYLQMNAKTITDPHSREIKKFVKKLLKNEIVDVVSTDAHHSDKRRPLMNDAYKLVCKKYGESYANKIFKINARKILQGRYL